MIDDRLGRRITFGPFTLYPEACELRKHSFRLNHAGPQAISFLTALVENAGCLVTKDALERRLWPGEVPRENRLNVVASTAWRILGDTDRASRKYFVSHGRDGYLFICPIARVESEPQHLRHRQAEEVYREGVLGLEKRHQQSLVECAAKFTEAIELDPSYSEAWSGLAVTHIMMGIHCVESPDEAFPKAETAAKEALRICPSLLEAQVALGWVALCYDRTFTKAESIFMEALAEDPRHPFTHNALALLNVARNRTDLTVRSITRARRLNAVSPPLTALFCHSLYLARRFENAAVVGARAVASDPRSCLGHSCLALVLLQLGDHDNAYSHATEARELSQDSKVYLGFWAYICAVIGKEQEAKETLRRFLSAPKVEYSPAYFVALIFLGLGEFRQCLRWLNQARRERSHWILFLGADPIFDVIRSNSSFCELVEKVGQRENRSRSEVHLSMSGSNGRPLVTP